jgi:hypothetical protein
MPYCVRNLRHQSLRKAISNIGVWEGVDIVDVTKVKTNKVFVQVERQDVDMSVDWPSFGRNAAN